MDGNSTQTFSVTGYGTVEWFLNGSPTGITGNTYTYSPSSGNTTILTARSSLAGRVYTKQWAIHTFSCNPLTHNGDVTIEKQHDLKILENVTHLRGNLVIKANQNVSHQKNVPPITDLDMLKCLHHIDGDLIIQNSHLRDIDGLRYLSQVTGDVIILNSPLDTLNLKSLTTIGGALTISDNTMLQSLGGLESLISVGAHITIRNNIAMRDIWGLSSLSAVNGDLIIADNIVLNNLDPLKDNLRTVSGDLVIISNFNLSNIVIDNLETIGSNLIIQNNFVDAGVTTSLDIIFDALETVGGYMDISNNTIMSLSGPNDFITMDLTFIALSSISGRLTIDNNAALATIGSSQSEGFPALKTIDGNLEVSDNDELTILNFQALEFISADMRITDNRILPFCRATMIKDQAVIGGEIDTSGNLNEPSVCGTNTVGQMDQPRKNLDAPPVPDVEKRSEKEGYAVNDGAYDRCPDDPAKTESGICGCGTEDTDSDMDGTPDCNDQCPADKKKIKPGVCGCGTPDEDTDKDGTPDCKDRCPYDEFKTVPGICGCGISDDDLDGDGISNCNDGCHEDPDKINPGICGCGVADIDSDGDGIPDCKDKCNGDKTDTDKDGTPDCADDCPDDAFKTDPGLCGCGISDSDLDNDGTPNCIDKCQNDPGKTEPGLCGCGVADIDSNHNGILDCNEDDCPNDPEKTKPGICGCGVADADSDNDGTYDCNDNCPNDPEKTQPGICGCGTADTDRDGDRTPDCQDQCPNDPEKTRPGQCGCGSADVDIDHDGIAYCNEVKAHVDIIYPDNRDLVVTIGVGEPDNPTWEKTIWEGDPQAIAERDVTIEVDISDGMDYLPPSESSCWYLRVHNRVYRSVDVNAFTIIYKGSTYSSDVSLLQKSISQSATYAYIPEAPEDTYPPQPRPPSFSKPPKVKASFLNRSITMTAVSATDRSDVEYLFEETTGNGTDSGWQDDPTFTDNGVLPWTRYKYKVKVRDKSTNDKILESTEYPIRVH